MTLRGRIADFPIETILQLLASTGKTGQLEVRGEGQSGSLGLDGGRLVAAATGDDVGEAALGAVFTVEDGDFEFIPWKEAPAANLSGDLDQLLDRAVVERNRIVAIREIVPSDELRFRLSERAAERGEVTLSADQWRALLAVNGERDVRGIAAHLTVGHLVALDTLSGLVTAGFIDIVEPPPAPIPAATREPPAPPAEPWSAPPIAEAPWSAPAAPAALSWPEPPRPSWSAPPAEPSWSTPAAPVAEPSWSVAPTEPEPFRSATPVETANEWEAASPEAIAPERPLTQTPFDTAPEEAPENDARLAALAGVFDAPAAPAPPAPVAQAEVVEELSRGATPATGPQPAPSALGESATPAAEPQPEEKQPEEKKRGLFSFLKRDEPASGPVARTIPVHSGSRRAGQLAAFANALLTEYNSGQYGKGQVDDRIANLLLRVDEQADPIDRPLPIVHDRIDVPALERENVAEPQAVPYLALLVTQVYEDAERAFGRDKAKRGYRAAQQQVFGPDASALAAPDVAGRLPKL